MSRNPRGIGHSLKEKLFLRSRKLSPQSTITSNSRLISPTPPALAGPSSPSILSRSKPSLQSPTPASNGESPLRFQHGITISTSLQNASSATAAPPFPSLWQRVYSIAKDQLSNKEREQLDLPAGNDSIESAISAAKSAHKAAKDRRWVYRRKQGNDIVVMERVGRILRGMENYAKIGDVLIQSSPEITALVWGTARFILQVGLLLSPSASQLILGGFPQPVRYH